MQRKHGVHQPRRSRPLLIDPDLFLHLGITILPNSDCVDAPFQIIGNTLPLDKQLTKAGGVWNSQRQIWTFHDREQLDNFVRDLPLPGGNQHYALREAPASYCNAEFSSTPLSRFLEHGPNVIDNAELLTLLLTFDRFVGEPAALSEKLIGEFGGLGAILGSEVSRLTRIQNVTPRTIGLIKAVQLILERVMHERLKKKITLGSWKALHDYLKIKLRHRKREELILLYLDTKNQLIREESIIGSSTDVFIHPDEITRRALELFAKGVILVHNHPTGVAEPSKNDIVMTNRVSAALAALDIQLHDHFIIGADEPYSFKSEGLI